MITEQQFNSYWKNGFVIINNALTKSECNYMNQEIRKYANHNFAAIMNPDRVEFLLAQSLSNLNEADSLPKKVNYVREAEMVATLMRSVMGNPKTLSCLEYLQKREIVGLMSQMLFKEVGSPYASQAWAPHQDNAYPKNPNGQYITTNFFFEDAKKENGSLYVYCGSHLSGLAEFQERSSYREKIGDSPGNKIPDEILNNFEKTDVTFKKGDMLVLHGDCIHGSYPNVSDRSRPLLSCSYISKGESFIPGQNAQRKIIDLY
jgi:ectoine hydroxylase-related dioxygenase (phytanoyl-CoA dioxygenase family)